MYNRCDSTLNQIREAIRSNKFLFSFDQNEFTFLFGCISINVTQRQYIILFHQKWDIAMHIHLFQREVLHKNA